MAFDSPSIEEIDEALWWARLADQRDEHWWAWVDQRLDERLEATSS